MQQRELAQSLRRRLDDRAVDVERLAEEAREAFDTAGRTPQVRWLTRELGGYGAAFGRASLDVILGVPESHRLVFQISAYRLQEGQVIEDGVPAGRTFKHFFVEPLRDLAAAARRVRSAAPLQLDFAHDIPSHPAALVFPGDVFERTLLGFRAVLHLELGRLAA